MRVPEDLIRAAVNRPLCFRRPPELQRPLSVESVERRAMFGSADGPALMVATTDGCWVQTGGPQPEDSPTSSGNATSPSKGSARRKR